MCRYHVPRSWLKPTKNLLIVFEEMGGDPNQISLVKRSVSRVCAQLSESRPAIRDWQLQSFERTRRTYIPKLHLHCAPNQYISSIKFASFGTPLGTCGSFVQGPCHAPTSYAVLTRVTRSTVLFCV